eukprot:1159622-Pelagomonas_calceolata.AAC.6
MEDTGDAPGLLLPSPGVWRKRRWNAASIVNAEEDAALALTLACDPACFFEASKGPEAFWIGGFQDGTNSGIENNMKSGFQDTSKPAVKAVLSQAV